MRPSFDTWRFDWLTSHRVDAGTQMRIDRQHLQHLGVVHGGVLAVLAGHTALAAAMSLDESDTTRVAPDLNLSIMRGAGSGLLWCESGVLSAGRRMSFVRADIRTGEDEGSKLVASGRFTLARSE